MCWELHIQCSWFSCVHRNGTQCLSKSRSQPEILTQSPRVSLSQVKYLWGAFWEITNRNAPLSRTFSSVIKCLWLGSSGTASVTLTWGPELFAKEAVRNQRVQETSGKAGSLVPLLINQDQAVTLLNASRWSWRQSALWKLLDCFSKWQVAFGHGACSCRSCVVTLNGDNDPGSKCRADGHTLGVGYAKPVTHEEPASGSRNAIMFWFHKRSSIIAFVFLLYLAWNRHSH